MAHSIGIAKLNLEVKTDHVDAGILNRFKKTIEPVLDLAQGKNHEFFKYEPTGDPKKFIKKHYVIKTNSQGIPKFKEIHFEIKTEYSSLTIMADILANSARYYLDKAQTAKPGMFLNNKEALEEHPLVHRACIPDNKEHIIPLIDTIYRRTD
jgi:hypothetical protein